MFDPKAPESKPILEFFNGQRALIVDPTSSSRNAIRKLFTNFGMSASQADAVDNYSDAMDFLNKTSPGVMVCNYELGDKTGIDILMKHRELIPNRLHSVFVLISGVNSQAVAGTAAQFDVDAMIIKPFTFDALEKKIIEIVEQKVKPKPYYKLIEDGKNLLSEQKFDEATQVFMEAVQAEKENGLAYYFLGYMEEQKENIQGAIDHFKKGLDSEPKHYRCLLGAVEAYSKLKDFESAYEYSARFVEAHPVSPKQVPLFVRLSVQNQKFEDVNRYVDIFNNASDMDEESAMYISAGLVVCGRYFSRHNKGKKSVEALKKAEQICRGKPNILREIVVSYYQGGYPEEATRVLGVCPKEVADSKEILLAEFESKEGGDDAEICNIGSNLQKKGIKSAKMMEMLVKGSVRLKRKPELIAELVAQGSTDYPELKEKFETWGKGEDLDPPKKKKKKQE